MNPPSNIVPPPLPALARPKPRHGSVMWKLAITGLLALLLQIPVFMVEQTLLGRKAYRDVAVAEIATSWGGEQTAAGPFLVVPYEIEATVSEQTQVGEKWIRSQTVKEVQGTAWFLPRDLVVGGRMECSERYRGIFRTPVYASRLAFRGRFEPDPKALDLGKARFDWSRATVVFSVSDGRGLVSAPVLAWGGEQSTFQPGRPRDGWPALIEAGAGAASAEELNRDFSFELELRGAPRLAVAPVGATTTVSLAGNWRDPSFDGNLLPASREVSEEGFSANWQTTFFGRGFPQQWHEHEGKAGVEGWRVLGAASGVTLANPVDHFRLAERSMKYSLLFIVLIFAVFFLFEVSAALKVHPFQYLLVGAALTLFHLGFLALGDFLGAGLAYTGAAVASSALIAGYAWSVLKTGRRTLLVAGGLLATYGGLYLILRMQDYALVAGCVALFVLLGAIMWFTRRIDWYGAPQSRGHTTEGERLGTV